MKYKVRTNRGWGWSVVDESGHIDAPAFGSQADAQKYAELRNQGVEHLAAWDRVEHERFQQESP
jgi:hypothetical protein